MDDDAKRLRSEHEQTLRRLEELSRLNSEIYPRFKARIEKSRRISEEGRRMQREAARRAGLS